MEITGKQFRKRNAILDCLRRTTQHPSAETIYTMLQQENSNISRASVYRNLALFKEQGLIISLGPVNGGERFDGRVDPHVHFACTGCGSVSDVPDLEIPEEIMAKSLQSLRCQVTNAQLMLYGLCETCLTNQTIQNI